jgi:hypothetical protein
MSTMTTISPHRSFCPITFIPPTYQESIKKILRDTSIPIKKRIWIYFKSCGVHLLPFQLDVAVKWWNTPKNLWRWQRGFSKSFMLVYLEVLRAILGRRVAYFVPFEKQLKQATIYFNQNPFLDQAGRRGKDVDGTFYIGGKPVIVIAILSPGNIMSGRFHDVALDELAELEPGRENLVEICKRLQRSLSDCKISFVSTPKADTVFQREEEYIISSGKGNIVHLNYQNCPDNLVSDTPEKMQAIEDSRLQAEANGTLWLWEQMELAIYSTCGQKAFRIKIEDIDPNWKPTDIGFDFHEWATGHIVVGVYYDEVRHPNDIWFVYERQHQYKESDNGVSSLRFIDDMPIYHGCNKYAGSYGFNACFCMDAKEFGVIDRCEKKTGESGLVYNALCYTLHFDPKLTPLTYHDFFVAYFDDPKIYKLHKEVSGDVYRNHHLDAGLLAIPDKSQSKFIFCDEKEKNPKLNQEEYRKQMKELYENKIEYY